MRHFIQIMTVNKVVTWWKSILSLFSTKNLFGINSVQPLPSTGLVIHSLGYRFKPHHCHVAAVRHLSLAFIAQIVTGNFGKILGKTLFCFFLCKECLLVLYGFKHHVTTYTRYNQTQSWTIVSLIKISFVFGRKQGLFCSDSKVLATLSSGSFANAVLQNAEHETKQTYVIAENGIKNSLCYKRAGANRFNSVGRYH